MLFKFLEYLINRAHQIDKRIILGWCLRFGIPFNSSHAFKILEVSNNRTRLKQKLSWFNKNHLRGMHACAISTIGELSAGLLMMKNFSPKKYRFILKNLNTEYLYQGRTHLFTECEINLEDLKAYQVKIAQEGIVEIKLLTSLFDKEDRLVSKVESLWQIKSWDQVKANLTPK